MVASAVCRVVMCLSVMNVSLALCVPPSTQPSASTQTGVSEHFDFALSRGESMFLGKSTLEEPTTSADPFKGQTVDQLFKGFISPNAKTERWRLKIATREIGGGGKARWQLMAILSSNAGPNGAMSDLYSRSWFIDQLVNQAAALRVVPLEEAVDDKSKPTAGVELHRFVYADIGGRSQYLTLAIGDRNAFREVIRVREELLDFTWKQGWYPLGWYPPAD